MRFSVHTGFGKSTEKPLRQRPGFQSNSLEVVAEARQHRQQRLGFARRLYFPHGPACIIHNADARLLDRHVESSKMVHAALLLLMLEAVTTDLVFTISLKRSTQNLQLSTSWPADYPIYVPDSDINPMSNTSRIKTLVWPGTERRGRMAADTSIVDTDIPARLDRLPWGRFHTLVVAALGITWILDG